MPNASVLSFNSKIPSQGGRLMALGVGAEVLHVPTVIVLPDVGLYVGKDVGADGRLLDVGRTLLVGLKVGRLLEVGRRLPVGTSVGLKVGFAAT